MGGEPCQLNERSTQVRRVPLKMRHVNVWLGPTALNGSWQMILKWPHECTIMYWNDGDVIFYALYTDGCMSCARSFVSHMILWYHMHLLFIDSCPHPKWEVAITIMQYHINQMRPETNWHKYEYYRRYRNHAQHAQRMLEFKPRYTDLTLRATKREWKLWLCANPSLEGCPAVFQV